MEPIKIKVDQIVEVAPTAELEEKTIDIESNGQVEVTPSEGYDGLSKVNLNVDVQPPVQDKEVEITQNGETNIIPDEDYYGLDVVTVKVNVQPNLQSKMTTRNGVVIPDSGYDGLSSVSVVVEPPLQSPTITITENGTSAITHDPDYYGLKRVIVHTNVQPNLENKDISITQNGTQVIEKDESYDGIDKITINTNVESVADPILDYITHPMSHTTEFTYNGDIQNEMLPLFEYNTVVEKINIPNATKIPSNFCANASGLKKMNARPTEIGNYSFQTARVFQGLSTIDFSNCQIIGANAFNSSGTFEYAKPVNLPMCTTLKESAFRTCAIDSIILPSIQVMEANCFSYSELVSCDIMGNYRNVIAKPSFIYPIPANAFLSAQHLKTLIIRAGFFLPLDNTNALTNTRIATGTGYIYVKDELVETYKAANNWSTYANQIKPISELPAPDTEMKNGDILSIDGEYYKILSGFNNGVPTNNVKLMSMNNIKSINGGSSSDVYTNTDLDTFLNSTWRNAQSQEFRNALILTNYDTYAYTSQVVGPYITGWRQYQFKEDTTSGISYGFANPSLISSIARYVVAPGIEDIRDYIGSEWTPQALVDMFYNVKHFKSISNPYYTWLRNKATNNMTARMTMDAASGYISWMAQTGLNQARALFHINLSKVTWTDKNGVVHTPTHTGGVIIPGDLDIPMPPGEESEPEMPPMEPDEMEPIPVEPDIPEMAPDEPEMAP